MADLEAPAVAGEPALDDDVEASPAPAAVRAALGRLAAGRPALPAELEGDPDLRAGVLAVCAASRSLTALLESEPAALDVLRDLDRRPPAPEAETGETELRRWKALEYLRIAARDLRGLDDLPATGAALATMAGDVLARCTMLAGVDDLVVVGMGKLGGAELNYASDVDLVLVGPDGMDPATVEARAREVLRLARTCFRVDANLRPEGRDGPLVRSVASYQAYWDRWAAPWEFQALLKARPVAGPRDLARAFTDAVADALWERPLSADDLRSLRAMKSRAEAEVARRGLAARELKRGAGGIRDVEFAVQLLQLVHGRHDAALRSPTTLVALAELAEAGYVAVEDAEALAGSYRFLRTVEHRVQLVDEQQVHTVPADPAERERLARVVGFRGDPEADALERFDAELASCRATVRAIHQRLYFRPLLEAFVGEPGGLPVEAAEARLAAFGFTDAERTRQAIRELTRGLTRSSRLMDRLLPLLLGWLADSPDPDAGLLGRRTLASGPQRSGELARAFRESPETARRLCLVLGSSPLVAGALHRNPDLIPTLGDDDALRARTSAELAAAAESALGWRDVEARHTGLRRFKERELARVGARDLLVGADVEATAGELTALAEATLRAALEVLASPLPFTVVAMGRFGGGELSYASDLDVLFVYDGSGADDFARAEALATDLLRFVKGATPAERLYLLDPDLRPEGRQGPLARSLDAFRSYFDRWAAVWERAAMVRARPVAGDPGVAEAFMSLLQEPEWGRPLTAEEVRELRRIKARVEKERIPAGEDPQFHLKLGRGSLSDVEFCVQLLQLQHGVASAGTMRALDRLTEAGAVSAEDAAVLAEAYRFCERVRNRHFLLHGSGSDALPQTPERLRRLARSLETTPTELRESYRRVTRRSRAVVERRFYGRD